MITQFKEFIDNVLVENLHPELQSLVQSKAGYTSKQALLAKKIKDLVKRGEKTGIEGNMPKGSSRAYLKHDEPHEITLDGKPEKIPVGTKVAIRASLDKHHNHDEYDGMGLGALQNHAEGGDHWVNKSYRILTQDDDNPNEYHSNKESGIFPPLIEHDHDNHEYTHVGHARDIKAGEFNELTKEEGYPKGISHKDFYEALNRFHRRNNGQYWEHYGKHEMHLDKVEQHPLVQKFMDYHGNTGHPTYDYEQKKNLGVFEHPDGSKHIVARDHGFSSDVAKAYTDARKNMFNGMQRNYFLKNNPQFANKSTAPLGI